MRVPLTKEILERINTLRACTGAGPSKILEASKADPNAPPGMTLGKISHITTGHIQTAYKDELEFILRYLESLPVIEFKDITPAYIKAIQNNIARTGLGPQAIISYRKKTRSRTIMA